MLIALRQLLSRLHYACTALLGALAIPVIRHLDLPMRLNWRGMLVFYWVGLGSKSIFVALLFALLAFPLSRTLGPFWARWHKQKLRIVLAFLFLLALSRVVQFKAALLLAIDALFLAELAERARKNESRFRKKAALVLISATYLFVGISLVLVYNDIVIASRWPVVYDSAFNRMDMWVLGGRSVSEIAHTMFRILPSAILRFLDFAYFEMFLVVGAAFLISAYDSLKRGAQFAGTCLTAYYIGLLVFCIWPTYGPYIFCRDHLAHYPSYLTTYVFQEAGITGLTAITQHQSRALGSGFYIAFPSLHIALPLIAMWYLRRWRPVFWLLAAYNCVIAIAIVILEWHYALDLPGGIVVGVLALTMVERQEPLGPAP